MNNLPLPAAALLALLMLAPGAQSQTLDEPGAPALPDDAAPDVTAYQNAVGVNLGHNRHEPAWARFASDSGNLIFLSAGILLPLVEDGKAGAQRSIRTADALVASTIVAEALKQVVHKKRPDGTDYQSFPSGHATAAFTVATMQADAHPRQAILWYAGASAIAASRVTLRRHDTADVLAGALLGYGTARLELAQTRGLILRPFVRQNGMGNKVSGVSFSKSF